MTTVSSSESSNTLTGAGGTTGAALTAIGSDLSVSLTYQVASELLDAAREEQMQEDELVGIVLGLAVVFSALRALLQDAVVKRRRRVQAVGVAEAERLSKDLETKGVSEKELIRFRERCKSEALAKSANEKSALEFVLVIVSIGVRICFGVSVQLLAASARARQTSRSARVISLVSLSVYFLWLESGSDSRAF